MRMSVSTFVLPLLALLLGVVSCAWYVGTFHYTMDDAFITFRYALNWHAGDGLLFNPNQTPRAEGLTSPFYAIVLASAPTLGWNIEIFAWYLGLLCLAATVLCIVFLSASVIRRSAHLRLPAAASLTVYATLAYLTDPFVAGNAVSGMETMLGTALFVGFAWALWYALSTDKATGVWLGVVAFVVPLVRPELTLSIAVAFLCGFIWTRERVGPLRIAATIFVVMGIIYFALRTSYYGLPLPLPYYVKQGIGHLDGLPDVWKFVLHVAWLAPVAVVAFLPSWKSAPGEDKPTSSFVRILVVMLAVQLAYYSTLRPIMGLGFRYFQPLVPLVIVITSEALSRIWTWARGRQEPLTGDLKASALIIVCVAPQIIANSHAYITAHRLYGAEDEARAISQQVAKAAGAQLFTIAMNDCGALPFYTGWQTLDLSGLNNRNLATDQTSPSEEIAGARPDFVLLVAETRHAFESVFGWEGLSADQVRALGYVYLGDIELAQNYHWLMFGRPTGSIVSLVGRLRSQELVHLPNE